MYSNVLLRLVKGDRFTSRISACALFPSIFEKLDTTTDDHLSLLFISLCQDETPMVRRAAAQSYKLILPHSQHSCYLPTFITLLSDHQDSVRLASIEQYVICTFF